MQFSSNVQMSLRRKSILTPSLYLLGLVMLAIIVSLATPPVTRAAGVVGNGTPASCTETALNNALAGGGLVTFNCGSTFTTIEFNTQKIISVDTTIDGGGLISLSRVGSAERLFAVSNNTTVFTLKNIRVENGYAQVSSGGAIYTRGTIVIENSTFRNNTASETSGWGSIYGEPGSNLTIINSTFDSNGGGNIFCFCNNTMITGSTFTKNSGGAINVASKGGGDVHIANSYFAENSLTSIIAGNTFITNSTFVSNTGGYGGAIKADKLTISDSTVRNNKAVEGGGIYVLDFLKMNNTLVSSNETTYDDGYGGGIFIESYYGDVTIKNSIISKNKTAKNGGGISSRADGGGHIRLINSLVVDNFAVSNGGGIYSNVKTLTVINSTIANNRVTHHPASTGTGYGGAIYLPKNAILNIANSTIVGNSASRAAGGIYTPDSFLAQVTIKNSIIAANSSKNCNTNILSATNYNLISDDSCGVAATDPLIGPLNDNGGTSSTYALLPGSPALNGGDPAGCTDFSNNLLTTDQRGFVRPSGGRCDIGAYEASLITVNSGGDEPDAAQGNGICETAQGNGTCTLRAALEEAQSLAGTQHIVFNIPQNDASYNATTGNFVFTPATALPPLSSVVLDGLNTGATCASPKIEINGSGLSSKGFNLQGGAFVGGLLVHGFNGPQTFSSSSGKSNNLRCVKFNRN